MKGKVLFIFLGILYLSISTYAQEGFKSEGELKEKASELFNAKRLIEATPLYAQLLSLYPQDAEYNFKYGACLLASDADTEKPIKFLSFALTKGADPLAHYYLGRAYHLNYEFAKAVKQYSRFKTKASSDLRKEYQVERQIEMCKNGNDLLSRLNEVQVIEKKEIAAKDFYRVYDLQGINGKLITTPEDFQSKYDKKIEAKSVIFLPTDAKELYYSSYGKKGETGRDIYKVIKLGSDSWSEPVKLGEGINTPYDEEYPYILPDGRTMYFASKGHNSMGGYDLFKSTFDQTAGKWKSPENLDFAFSSADDDIMFVTDASGQLAYFASNRSNEAGKFTVYKVLVEKKAAEVSVIKGTFIAENNPDLKKAKVTVVDKATNETIGVYETDKNGNYAVEIASNGGSYQFSLETTEDAPIHTGVVSIPKQDEFSILGQELRLVGLGNDQQLVIKNIFDGTTAANTSSNGPQISSELLRMKANLDVNFAASNLDQLSFNKEAKEVETASIKKPEVSNLENTATANANAAEGNNAATSSTTATDTPNSANASTSSSVANTPAVKAKKELLSDQLKTLKNEVIKTIQLKEKVVNSYYANAVKLQQEAAQLFQEKEQLTNSGADADSIAKKIDEAKIKALEAGFATQIALKMNANEKQEKSLLTKIESAEESINSASSDELNSLEAELKNLENAISNAERTETIIQKDLNEVAGLISKSKEEISSNQQKRASLDDEQQRIEGQINELVLKLENADEAEEQSLSQQIDQLSIDLEDIAYQQYNNTQEYKASSSEVNALTIQEKLLNRRLVELDSLKVNPSTAVEPIDESARKALLDQMKLYRDNDQMAYSSMVNLEVGTVSSLAESKQSDQLANSNISSEIVKSINVKYEQEIEEVQSNADLDLKAAQELRVYDNWINELENKLVESEAARGQQADGETSNRREIEELQTQIDIVGKRRGNLEDLIAQNSLVAENESVESNVDSDVETTPTVTANLDSSPDTESKFAETTSTEQSSKNDEIQSPTIDLSEVNSKTVINESFTNLDFKQEVVYDDAQSQQEILSAKKALFEASKLSEQAEEARQAAYSLPSVEERTAAFERANQLESLSEAKQIEAANYYARFNKNEYLLNQQLINNADQYEDEFESSNLDIANLLSEEAQSYFNSASDIRASIDANVRHSIKEVELQKAYDYEVLALNKQQEALKKLNLASKDYNDPVASFVQTITDVEVLAVSNASIARKYGDSLSATVTNLKQEADSVSKEAQKLPIGGKRDSLLTAAETLTAEADRNEKKAALFYQREEQINTGAESETLIAATIIRPRKIKEFESTTIELDTVEISEERKQLVLNSQAFIQYANSQRDRDRVAKEAELEYQNAMQLSEKLTQLQIQAVVENNKADAAQEGEEKQRLIKSAQVIDQKALAITNTIDSINRIIKIKNYLISTAEQKMSLSLATLSEIEKGEIKQLSRTYQGDLGTAEDIAQNVTAVNNASSGSIELVSSEASEAGIEQSTQNIDVNTVSEIPTEDSGVLNSPNETAPNEPVVTNNSTPADNRSNTTETSIEDKANINDAGENNQNVAENSAPINAVISDINKVPREVKQAIFITLDKQESVYGVSNPIPLNIQMPEGLVYKVQVGAFRNPIPQDLFKGFAPLSAEKTASGITRYTAGFFVTEQTAITARNSIRSIGYPDAFVVAFYNGERVSLSEARANSGEEAPSDESTSTLSQSKTIITKTPKGSAEGLTNRFNASNSVELEKVVNVATIEGVYYTVQIGVYSKPIKKGTFSKYSDLNICELPSGLIRYNTGIFNSSIAAADLKITVKSDIADAFVTAYKNGKRISLNEAVRLKNQE